MTDAARTEPKGYVPFTGELDAPKGFVPFDGELDPVDRELTDAEVFGTERELTDEEVFGTAAAPAARTGRRGTMRSGARPYAPGPDPRAQRQELPSDVVPSTAGAGRGAIAEQAGERERWNRPLSPKEAAIEAASMIADGQRSEPIYRRMEELGVSRFEVDAAGKAIGAKAFDRDRPVAERQASDVPGRVVPPVPVDGEARPIEVKPRTMAATANDLAITGANTLAGLAKAGVDLAMPGSAPSKRIEDFIEAGQQAQSLDQRERRAKLRESLATADGELDKAGRYLLHAITEDPLGTFVEGAANLAGFGAAGVVLRGAQLGKLGLTTAAMGMGASLTAGEVRGNIWDALSARPEAVLLRESPEYKALRAGGMDEGQAKRELGANLMRNLPEIVAAGAIGALGGKYGLEAMATGVKLATGRVSAGLIGFIDEASQGAVEQLATNYGVRRALPGQSLTEDVAMNAAAEGLPGLIGGVIAGGNRQHLRASEREDEAKGLLEELGSKIQPAAVAPAPIAARVEDMPTKPFSPEEVQALMTTNASTPVNPQAAELGSAPNGSPTAPQVPVQPAGASPTFGTRGQAVAYAAQNRLADMAPVQTTEGWTLAPKGAATPPAADTKSAVRQPAAPGAGQIAQGELLRRAKGPAPMEVPTAAESPAAESPAAAVLESREGMPATSPVTEVAQQPAPSPPPKPSAAERSARRQAAAVEVLSKVFETRGQAVTTMVERSITSLVKPVQAADGTWRLVSRADLGGAQVSPQTAVTPPPAATPAPTPAKYAEPLAPAAEAIRTVVESPAPTAETPAPTPAATVPEQAQPAEAPPVADLQPVEPTHADPGQAPEPATAPVVAKAVKKGADTTSRKPAELRADILGQIDNAIAASKPDADDAMRVRLFSGESPTPAALTWLKGSRKVSEPVLQKEWSDYRNGPAFEEVLQRVGHVELDVPGDGTFKVLNTPEALAEFRKKVEASPGFKATARPPAAQGATGNQRGSASAKAAITAMIDEGDGQAAVDYAAAKGLTIAELGLSAERATKVAGLVPTGDEAPGTSEAAKPVEEQAAEIPLPSNDELAAEDYAALAGRKVGIKVLIEDSGKVATLTMDAPGLLRELDTRINPLQSTGTPAAQDLADFKERVETLKAAGLEPADANRVATSDLVASLQSERQEALDAAREQHSDLPAGRRKITDTGAKIGGARKDRWATRGMNVADLDSMTEAEGAELVNKAAVWKPDFAAMVTAGTAPKAAALVKIIFDRLAAQPKDNTPTGRRRYVTMMQAVRASYSTVKTEQEVREAKANLLFDHLRWTQALDGNDASARRNAEGAADLRAHMEEARRTLFSVYKGRMDPFTADWGDQRRADEMIREGFPGKAEAWTRRFEISRAGGAGATDKGVTRMVAQSTDLGTPVTAEQARAGVFIVLAKTNRRTLAYAATKADAETSARALHTRAKDEKQAPKRPHLDDIERKGMPQRIDREVTAEDFVETFGFRGIEFGNWAAQDERQRLLTMAYDGLQDLAEIVGVPPKALSLNGTLGLAFGARGGGKASAHYEPGKLVINMTKLSGAGSLAHEWAHAVDHYFGELDRGDAYETRARGASGWYAKGSYTKPLANLRPEVGAAFNEVVRALFTKTMPLADAVRRAELQLETAQGRRQQAQGSAAMEPVLREVVQRSEKYLADARDGKVTQTVPTSYEAEARKLSGKSESGYWQRPTEMFARAFESYVFDRVLGMGARSDYLVHGVESDRFAGGAYKGNPYPVGDERTAINSAFEHLFDVIETRETVKGVAMFALGDAPAVDPANPDVRFADGTVRMGGKDIMLWPRKTKVQEIVDEATASWANKPAIKVIEDMRSAPMAMRYESAARRKAGAAGQPLGFYFGDTNTLYLVASALDTRTQVVEVLLHESVGHWGLRGVFGDALDDVLDRVAAERPQRVRAKAKRYALDYTDLAERRIAAEEVLAEMAQKDPRASLVQQALAALRQWLRTNMPGFAKLKFTDEDLIALILEPARRYVMEGGPYGRDVANALFGRGMKPVLHAANDAPPTSDTIMVDGKARSVRDSMGRRIAATDEGLVDFWKWFGDSKAVDAIGRPRVLFHGTTADFEVFRPSLNGDFGGGIYLTPSPEVAGSYVTSEDEPPSVMAVYWRTMNPYVSSSADINENGHADRTYMTTSSHALLRELLPAKEAKAVIGKLLAGEPVNDTLAKAVQAKGYDGIIGSYAGEESSTEYVALRPEDVKSAIGNDGTFDPKTPVVRFARDGYRLRAFGKGARAIEVMQDRYNRWKQAIDDVREQGGTISDDNDFYRAEERYWGRVGARLDEFQDEVRDFARAVAADGLTLEQVATYAYALHAQERNAAIAERRDDMPGAGSGMTDQEAQDILDSMSGDADALNAHAGTLQSWVRGTRDVLLDGGLISPEQHTAWSEMFEHYVPLRGLEGAEEPRFTGKGFNIRGEEGMSAEGRHSQAKQILERIVQDRTRALVRSGKNEVLRSLATFVLDNPSPDLWSVEGLDVEPEAGMEEDAREEPTVTAGYVTLKDAGKEIRVHIHDGKLLEQLKAMNREDDPSRLVAGLLFANRVLGRLYTSLSPVFVAINFLRDIQAAAFGLIDEVGFMAAPKLFAKLPGALRDAWKAELGTKTDSYQLFSALGGKTAYIGLRDLDQQAAELQALVRDGGRSAVDPRKFGPALMALIEGINGGVENATRLAAFEVAVEAGKSHLAAASIAKNITVNFNRRGTQQLASAWVLFFNPAVQGTARIVQSLAHPRVQSTLAVAMLGVAALALRNAAMGDDDDGVAWWDKIPDEVKERNLIIMLPPGATAGEEIKGSKTGRYVKIPMAYGYNFFAVVANQVVDVWRNAQAPRRGRGALAGGARAFSSFMNSWLPVGSLGQAVSAKEEEAGAKSLVLMATPDALDPVAQSLLNLSAFGRKMSPDHSGTANTPDSEAVFPAQVGTIWQRTAREINSATGGDKYRSGVLDFSPATIENLVRGYGGGPALFAMDVINSMYARQSIERPDLEARRLPFAKQAYGVIDNETDRMAGYARLDKTAEKAEPVESARRAGDLQAARELLAEGGEVARLGGAMNVTRRQLGELSKRERQIIESSRPDGEKYALLLASQAQKRKVLQAFTSHYDAAVAKTAGIEVNP